MSTSTPGGQSILYSKLFFLFLIATQAVFVDDPSNPYGRSQLVVTSQLCIPKKGYRNSTMGQWCQENCLKYPPNCDTNLCECL